MLSKDVADWISGVVIIVAFIPYIVEIIQRKTIPSKSTWIIWAILDTITLESMWSENSHNMQIVGAVIGVWIVVALSCVYGRAGWKRIDKICLACAAIGIALRLSLGGEYAVFASCFAIFIGSYPTFEKTWDAPEEESKLAWILYFVSCLFGLYAVKEWTWIKGTQPITYFVIESVMILLIFRPYFLGKRTIA